MDFDLFGGITQAVEALTSVAAGPITGAIDSQSTDVRPAADTGGESAQPVDAGQAANHFSDIAADSAAAWQGPQMTEEQKKAEQDRINADLALQSRFKVLDPTKHEKSHNGREITPEEYEKIRQTYIDVKNGKGDLDMGIQDVNQVPLDQAQLAGKNNAMKLDDLGNMLETKAGRELLYKLNNNVGSDGKTHIHTSVSPDDAFLGPSGDSFSADREAGQDQHVRYGMGTQGSDRKLFGALTNAFHRETATTAEGNINDPSGTAWRDEKGEFHHVSDGGSATAKADDRASRETAQVLGVDGYGVDYHGVSMTENEYDREQRANGKDKAAYPIFTSVNEQRKRDLPPPPKPRDRY